MTSAVALDHDHHPGEPDRPPVVLLHGLTGSRASYVPVVDHLSGRGWPVVAADLRGHGRSPRAGSYRAVDYAADVAALVAGLPGGRAVVAGHSLGGLAAHALAQQRPGAVVGVFLEDPPLYEGDDARRAASPAAAHFPAVIEFATALQASADEEAAAATVATWPTPFGTTFGERFGHEAALARARDLLAVDVATIAAAVDGTVWRDYDPDVALSCPVTALRADPRFGPVLTPADGAALLAATPAAEVVEVAGVGHAIHGDPAGLAPYLDALDRFLAAIH